MKKIRLMALSFLAGGIILNAVKLTDIEMLSFFRAALEVITGMNTEQMHHECKNFNEVEK